MDSPVAEKADSELSTPWEMTQGHREPPRQKMMTYRKPMSTAKKIILPDAPTAPATLEERWMDTEYQLNAFRWGMENTHYLGESYPLFNPNLGPDVLGAVCGCDLHFGEVTSWASPCIEDYETHPSIVFDENNFWWKKISELTQAAVEDAKGEYLVGITDLHPSADAIVSLRGAENAAMDLYDEPDQFIHRTWEVHEVFKEMTRRLHNIIAPHQRGCSNWMGIVHPDELWYVTSCDFIYMISKAHFEEFIAPELLAEVNASDSMVHAICSHGYGICSDVEPVHEMEKILFASDELTGLIGAAIRMRPSKSVQDLEVSSLKKKFKDKKFAAGCSRDVIRTGAERMGVPTPAVLRKRLETMRDGDPKGNGEI